jgi:trimethylamine---corrinoid protein Co-methyltransferase
MPEIPASATPPLQPITPAYHVNILEAGQLARLRAATLEILEQVGVHCPSQVALKIYAEHGARLDPATQIVRLPADLVERAMAHAPRSYVMGARSPTHDLMLDGRSTFLATDGCGVETIDFVTRQRRPSCKQDVAVMARVSDFLSSIGFYWPIVSAQDFPATAPLHELDASFNNTVKHVQSETIMGASMARFAVEMARVIAGDEASMRSRPPLSLLVCCIAPLGLDAAGVESALALAAAGLPVGFMSMANLGSTGPATPAGTLVAADAEIVAALTLIQLQHPGAPVFHSMMPGIMHPRTGAYLGTAWEGTLLYPVGVEMAHGWGVPSLAGVFATDAAVPGWQSAGDAASSLMLCALVGADTGSGLGLLESCRLLYPEEILLDSDIYHRVRLEAAGLDTSPTALALDVIREVGPRGHYLKHPHTRRALRGVSFSELANQPAPHGSYQDPVALAREKFDWIHANHHPEPLEPGQQHELTRILEAADRQFAGRPPGPARGAAA